MLPGGIVGITISFYAPDMAEELPRLIFTMVALVFGIALVISHWALGWRPQLGGDDRIAGKRNHFHLVLVGVLGGYISGLVGSGVDLLGFIALTLAYGFHERLAVPTTVVIMAALSVVGTALFGFAGHETVGLAYPYWLVCAPVVAVGAPFGAWAVSKAPRELVVYFVLFLILLEAVSTTILLGWSGSTGLFALGVGVVTAIYFLAMIRYRNLTRTNGAGLTLSVECFDLPASENFEELIHDGGRDCPGSDGQSFHDGDRGPESLWILCRNVTQVRPRAFGNNS